MKKKRLVFFALAAACILMLAMAATPQARRAKIAKPVVKPAGSEWATPINISVTNAASESPVLALDAKGNAYVSWTEWTGSGMARNMMFNTNETGLWHSSKTIAPLLYDAIDDVGFPTVVAYPTGGKAYVGYHDADFSRMVMAIMGWEYSSGGFGSKETISYGAPSSSYVTLALSPTDNNIYAVWMSDIDGQFALIVRYRDPNTRQWSSGDIPDFPRSAYLANMFIDAKGAAHLVFITRPYGSIVWYSKNPTPKNAGTWTAPFQITPNSNLNWTYPKVTADGDGDAYVVWQEDIGGNIEILLRRQVNGAWQARENISQTGDLSETASIAVDPTTKEMYIAWQELVGGSNWEIYVKTYEFDKATATKKWSSITNFSNSPWHSGEPCFRIAANGDVHMVFYDQLSGPENNWMSREILYTYKQKARIYAPTSVTLTTAINKILFYSEKMNTITFVKNPDNDDSTLANYKLYRRKAEDADDKFEMLTTLNLTTFKYEDRKLPLNQKYAYALSTVDKDGKESEKTAVVTEK
jgi:hypothetical protein